MIAQDVLDRASRIKLLILDVDGVLTDGRIVLGNYGDELKFFDIHDGHGVVLLHRAGIKTVIISGRHSRINIKRAKEMRVLKVYQNAHDKLKVFDKVLKKCRVAAEEVCYVGDDVIDLPVLRRAGLSAAVQNAVEEVRKAAHYVTERSGGRGAVREVADLLLKSQNRWDELMELYRR